MKIAIVENESGIADFLSEGLQADGYTTVVYDDGLRAAQGLNEDVPDLVLLDLMLPGQDGFAVLSTFRAKHPNVPVIMLTALNEVEDRVKGLDAGANDYLAKPFAFSELRARVRAHLRDGGDARGDELVRGDLRLLLNSHSLECGDKQVTLSSKEFSLAAYFLRHAGQVLSRQQILDGVWGYAFYTESNVVDAAISSFRKRLASLPTTVTLETMRGSGYVLKVPQ